MVERPAVKRRDEIIAECEMEGVCRWRQDGRGIIWLSCGLYAGMKRTGHGLVVLCKKDN